MRSKKIHIERHCLAAILYLCCVAVQANDVKGSLSATSLFSDNGAKTQENPIEERQDLYEIGLTADYTNWLVEAEANYDWVSQKFSEQSQTDDRYAEGNSSVVFGKQEDPLALELNHSRRILLTTPDAVALTQNQQAREMISVLPEIRANFFAADRLLISGEFTRVRLLDNELQDSERNGASVGWLHPLSAVSFLRFNTQQQKISFDHFPTADYTFSAAMLAYEVALRKLRYGLEVGYNQSEPEGGEQQGAPSYRLSASYVSGFNQFALGASRILTDTSFGNGNLENPSGLPGNDGLTQGVNRMDRTSADMNWQTEIICTRCQFSLGASAAEDDYLEKVETSLNISSNVRFAYSFSSAANLSFTAIRSDVDFDEQSISRDYELNTLSLQYTYNFDSGFSALLKAENEERKTPGSVIRSENGEGTYEENIYGVGLSYNF
jgi:hypothetical protein